MADGPFDPRLLSCDEFILGDGGGDPDIHDCFAKPFETILGDMQAHDCGSGLEPTGTSDTPSDIQPGYSYREVEDGLLLLSPEGAPVGGYLSCDVGISEAHRGKGLGAELVLEYAMRHGSFPVAFHDKPGFSRRGWKVHVAAWDLAADRALFGTKAARLKALDADGPDGPR